MTADEPKSLCRGARVYGDAQTNWNAVTIVWKNGHGHCPSWGYERGQAEGV